MTTFTRAEDLNAEDQKWFDSNFSQYKPKLKTTGETITEQWETGGITRVIIKGSWTPYGCMRDCGDHYIVARYSRFDRVSKDLQTIAKDVNDI